MTYRHSRARRTFETQLDLAIQELTPLYKIARKQGTAPRLLAAYYVFAYSQFEVYIKSFVEDSIKAFNLSPPTFDKWPDLLLGYTLHKSEKLAAEYRRFGIDEDENAILEAVAQAARKIASWSNGKSVPSAVRAGDVLDKKKYPSPKNMPQLFRRLGIKAIWAVIGKAGKMNGELILTSLNDLRTDIAHEGKVPPGFSLPDFRDRLNQMRRFVAAIDRGVATHFCGSAMSRAAWNAAMT
ncbi:HEPN domain-containing protein [Burkholderia stagnalis]|uniref:HEPN domain-containing protein n=1 Tax=Burkholderia stagnalis TaxID=1503054 RepID=UPI000B246163|nr:HEPN domain-containing protein [Burkholderia stagnalis]